MSEPAVVGRLAPSPTGRLHLGHARSFLLAWWSARAQGGRVVLRVEDLDGERVKPGATDLVLEDLAWLGLDWDGEPLLQSSRRGEHHRALERLVAEGRAYPCVCTRREWVCMRSCASTAAVLAPDSLLLLLLPLFLPLSEPFLALT